MDFVISRSFCDCGLGYADASKEEKDQAFSAIRWSWRSFLMIGTFVDSYSEAESTICKFKARPRSRNIRVGLIKNLRCSCNLTDGKLSLLSGAY